MGEIADALRRARGRKPEPAERRPSRPRPPSRVNVSIPETPGQQVILPRTRVGSWIAREVLLHRGGPGTECYRHFALQVQRGLARLEARSLLVVGPLRQEGKTTTACNTALALTSMAEGRRIALVDLDLRRPGIGPAFGIRPQTGIEQVLRGEASLGAARLETDLPGLDLYLVRQAERSPEALLGGPSFLAVLKALEKRYEVVVIDTPPVLLVPDSPLMAQHVGAYVVVVRAGRTRVHAVKALLDVLPRERMIGTLFNEGKRPRHSKQYGYYLEEEA